LDIAMSNNYTPGDWKKSYSVFHLQRLRSIISWKLFTR